MILAKTLVYAFNLQYDRIATNQKNTLRLEDKLFYINKAIHIYFKRLLRFAETNSEVRASLRKLEQKEVPLDIKKRTSSYDIVTIPEEYIKLLRYRVVAEREGCGTKEFPVVIMSTDDLNLALKNPYWKSSFQWEHCLGDEGSEGLFLFHGNDFSIKRVLVDAYKKPEEVHAPSLHENSKYVDWSGELREADINLDFDINFDYHSIIDIAILLAKADAGDTTDFEINLNKILNLEKLNL